MKEKDIKQVEDLKNIVDAPPVVDIRKEMQGSSSKRQSSDEVDEMYQGIDDFEHKLKIDTQV